MFAEKHIAIKDKICLISCDQSCEKYQYINSDGFLCIVHDVLLLKYVFLPVHLYRPLLVPPTTTSVKISQNGDILAKVYLVHLKVKHCQT